MPFGDWDNFGDCVAEMMEKEGYTEEVAKKVCGKLKNDLEKSQVAPPREDDSPLFNMNLTVLEKSERKIRGVASIPEIDLEKEIVLKAAIEEALRYFMDFPILHLNHTERPVGWVYKAWFDDSEQFTVEAQILENERCDDVWNAILKGYLSQFSIFGTRKKGTAECSLPSHKRKTPCVTKGLWLDSISICPGGNAINQGTFFDVIKARANEIGKAFDSSSNLSHPTVDGTKRKGNSMEGTMIDENMEQVPPYIKLILDRLDQLEARFGTEEKAVEGEEEEIPPMSSQPPEEAPPEEEGGGEPEGEEEEALPEEEPEGEPEEAPPEEEPEGEPEGEEEEEEEDKVQKAVNSAISDLKKAHEKDLSGLNAKHLKIKKALDKQIEDLTHENDRLRKAVAPKQPVLIPGMMDDDDRKNILPGLKNIEAMKKAYGGK